MKGVVNLRAPILPADSTEQDFPVVQGRFWLRQRRGKAVFILSKNLSFGAWGKMINRISETSNIVGV